MKRDIMTIKHLDDILNKVYSKETCYSKYKDKWHSKNPAFGHCAVVSLIVNDFFGGIICKIKVDNISHYFNLIDDQIIDLTAKQFNKSIDYSLKEEKDRIEILKDNDTLKRYNILKAKLNKLLFTIK